MGPDKFDNKNLVLKKYFSSLNKKKNWFHCEKISTYYQHADFLVQTSTPA